MNLCVWIFLICIHLISYVVGREHNININEDVNISVLSGRTYNLVLNPMSEKQRHRVCYVTGDRKDDMTLTMQGLPMSNCDVETDHIIIERTKFQCDMSFQSIQAKLQLTSQNTDRYVQCSSGNTDNLTQTDRKNHIIYYIVIPSSLLIIFIILVLYSCYRFLRQKPTTLQVNPYSYPDNNLIDLHAYTRPTKQLQTSNEYIDVIDLVSEKNYSLGRRARSDDPSNIIRIERHLVL
ncbi:hypothetical protein Btru_044528 [Bulinus truncatus]|nr:hypothetical protein Btru_044528 [Bulinus truncatus]